MEKAKLQDYQIPVEIEVLSPDDKLRVIWSDGHISRYDGDYLRGACPCATCKGNHLPMEVVKIFPIKGVSLLDYRLEGKYGLRILFSDGHNTGIYNFQYLRKVCRCQNCIEKQTYK